MFKDIERDAKVENPPRVLSMMCADSRCQRWRRVSNATVTRT